MSTNISFSKAYQILILKKVIVILFVIFFENEILIFINIMLGLILSYYFTMFYFKPKMYGQISFNLTRVK